MLKIIECPRDAMQGLHDFIPTDEKVRYINQLLKVGFDTIDFGSFVSPKAIPQMRDTAEVLSRLDLENNTTKLLAIIANERGAADAAQYKEIDYLGYPFSISETFQLRNTNATIDESLERVKAIQELCVQHNKKMVLYISMGFGNPYGDEWNVEIVHQWVDKLIDLDIKIFSLSDTIGVSNPHNISYLFKNLIPTYPTIEFGAHLHTTPNTWFEKIDAAYISGCRRFDGAIKGFGGCPMAKDELTGNMATENVLYMKDYNSKFAYDEAAFNKSMQIALEVFPKS
jgi:hydroxymethylglutaryl-CoA lyase